MRTTGVWTALLATTACATLRQSDSTAIFASPSGYVGEEVVVCGYLAGVSNIVPARDIANTGLSILIGEGFDHAVRKLSQRTRACLHGRIEYLGCQSDAAICLDWAYDYAIRVDRIL